MPKPFEPSASYKGFAQSQGFQPIRPGDITPLLRQNQQTEQQNLQRLLDQEMNVRRINQDSAQTQLRLDQDADKRERENARNRMEQRYESLKRNRELERVFSEQQMEDLMGFSKTLTESVQGLVEWRKNQVVEESMNEAFLLGLPPAEAALFDEKEAAAEGAAVLSKTAGATLEANGAPVDLITKARNASGWKKYGYMKAIAMMAGAGYGSYRESSKITVMMGDREVGLNTGVQPANSSEYAAVERKIRDSYLAQFDGMNLGLLNKYLFPQMQAYETKAATAFAVKQKEALLSDRKIERKNSIYAAAIAGMGAQELLKQINLGAGDFGGRGKARQEILKDLADGLKGGRFKPEVAENIEKMLNEEVEFSDGVKGTIASRFRRDIDDLEMLDAIDDAKNSLVNAQIEENKNLAKNFKVSIRQQIRETTEPLTHEQIMGYRQVAKRLGITDLVDDFLGDLQTVEAGDVDEAKLIAEGYIDNKGYISELEADNLPSSVRAYYRARNMIRDSETVDPTPNQLKSAKGDIVKEADAVFNAEGKAFVKKNSAYRDFVRTGNERYQDIYRSLMLDGSVDSHAAAHKEAMRQLQEEMKVGSTFGKPLEDQRDYNRQQIYDQAREALKQTDGDFTSKLPGLDSHIERLGKSFASGKGTIPLIFKQLAQSVDGVSSFDMAAAQYEAYTGLKLQKPQVEKDFDKLDPNSRRLLDKLGTGARWEKVVAQDPKGAELFFSLVKNKESLAYGEYDAMNTGGSGWGYGNRAVGSANSKDVFGRGVSAMTVGEVMELQRQEKLFAAGAYQIIPKTLAGVIQEAGVSLDDKFDKATQDKLALALYRRRVRWHGKGQYALMKGLRAEWQGLFHVPDATLLQAIEGVSYYNQNANILPGLQR